jgi:acyl transferase domain-containing protein
VPHDRKKALVICPGRGTYNKAEHGYLRRLHADRATFIDMVDAYRAGRNQATMRDLDSGTNYAVALHSRGDNASPLIFACSYADFLSLDRSAYDVVAVTGNSMGWYTALACGGALSAEHALWVVNSMGTYMQEALIGGQIIYSLVDENWHPIPGRREILMETLRSIEHGGGDALHISIELGGMIVFAGTLPALDAMQAGAPTGPGKFPMRLHNHAAFHSPLQGAISAKGKAALKSDWFRAPSIPMIDGRGHIWRPWTTERDALWDYTLGTQVVETYDFTRAVLVGLREFAPDCLIILGPGDTLGSAVAQSLIAASWSDIVSKTSFIAFQQIRPFVLSMGRPEQRELVLPPADRNHVL